MVGSTVVQSNISKDGKYDSASFASAEELNVGDANNACHLDPLLDDSVSFAKKRDLNKKVDLHLIDDLPHGFLNFSMVSIIFSTTEQIFSMSIQNITSLDEDSINSRLELLENKLTLLENEIDAHFIITDLVVEENVISSTGEREVDSGSYTSASMTAFCRMRKDEHAWIRTTGWGTDYFIFSKDTFARTSFLGLLVHPE
ncbi:HSL [Mytilus edulis]|uniref:LIPE n=1 Tax=Mytilus edulis TaxID=6550 RepID=A0A8S3QT72_MYTED|nr:HSL [Mytilus edulis]